MVLRQRSSEQNLVFKFLVERLGVLRVLSERVDLEVAILGASVFVHNKVVFFF
jgi:hypothetical protein